MSDNKEHTSYLEVINRLPTNIPSFGGKDLQENIKKTETALAEMEHLKSVWNHAHTQWMWRHLNLSHHHPHKNMRQISAEIARKESALNAAKWGYANEQITTAKMKEQLEDKNLGKWQRIETEMALAQANEVRENGLRMVEGCVKDILCLHELYQNMMELVGEFDENDIEEDESKSHLQRSIIQCIRDVRERGTITAGQQEYLEQIGVNPSKMQVLLRAFVQKESEEESDWGNEGLYEFVNNITDELIDNQHVDEKRMLLQGLPSEHNKDFSTGDYDG